MYDLTTLTIADLPNFDRENPTTWYTKLPLLRKDRLIVDLKSGRFIQGHGRLKFQGTIIRHCCLGVYCEQPYNDKDEFKNYTGSVRFNDVSGSLPEELCRQDRLYVISDRNGEGNSVNFNSALQFFFNASPSTMKQSEIVPLLQQSPSVRPVHHLNGWYSQSLINLNDSYFNFNFIAEVIDVYF